MSIHYGANKVVFKTCVVFFFLLELETIDLGKLVYVETNKVIISAVLG